MNSFFKANKNLISYFFIILIIIPIFGFKFLVSFIGNMLLLLFLVPLLFLIIAFLGFNSFKSLVKNCNNCGAISLGFSNSCNNCGNEFMDINYTDDEYVNNPSERIIEVKAEEIK